MSDREKNPDEGPGSDQLPEAQLPPRRGEFVSADRDMVPDDGVRGERLQHELDMLTELVYDEAIRGLDSPLWSSPQFLAWVAAEGRDRDRHRWTNGELLRAGDRLMASVRARQAPVRRVREKPPGRRPTLEGTPAQVLELARAEGSTPVIEMGAAAGVGRELWDEPCERWVRIPDDVPPGKYVALNIVGDSMAPLMHTGDVVLVNMYGEVRRDRVIVACHPEDGYVCKRVVRVTREAIELASIDPTRAGITIPRDRNHVLGTVVLVWCTHKE